MQFVLSSQSDIFIGCGQYNGKGECCGLSVASVSDLSIFFFTKGQNTTISSLFGILSCPYRPQSGHIRPCCISPIRPFHLIYVDSIFYHNFLSPDWQISCQLYHVYLFSFRFAICALANGQREPINVVAYQAIIEPNLPARPKMGLNNHKFENLFYEYPAFDVWKPLIEISLVYAVGTLIKEADLQNPVFNYNLFTFVIKKNPK